MDKKVLSELQSRLGDIRATLEEVHEAEVEAYDEKSDNWKESEKGQQTEEIIAGLEAAVSAVEQADTELEAILLSHI